MNDLTDDEQLQLAIQMSLGDVDDASKKRRRASPTIQPAGQAGNQGPDTPSRDTIEALTSQEGQLPTTSSVTSPRSASAVGFSGLDRRAMEQERLARAAKRVKVEPSDSRSPKQTSQAAYVASSSFAVATVKNGSNSSQRQHDAATSPLPPISSQQVDGPRYLHGAIKRTWASSHPRNNDVTIEEVLQSEHLRKAALSSFQWDNDWLWTKLDLTRTNVMVIMQGKTEYDRREVMEDAKAFNPRIKVCFPPMHGQVNCMHSKLMLLFYDSYMRIAVPTANLTKYDWGDDGRMENAVFLIDLPERNAGVKQTVEELTPFGQQLQYFLKQMEVPDHLLSALLRYDFTGSRHLAFVHSIGNDRQAIDPEHRTGYPGLGQAVKQLGLQTEDLQLEIAASSIGALKSDFLGAIYDAARGKQQCDIATINYKSRTREYEERMRIYFPAEETVMNSLGGADAAGTISLQRRWYHDPSFPKEALRDYRSTRPGLLSHNKIILGRGVSSDSSSPGGTRSIAWAYVGSHNLSESAWGRVTIDKSSKLPKINCKNWECGVLMRLDVAGKVDEDGLPNMSVFKQHLDIPFTYPGDRYGEKQPWFFNS